MALADHLRARGLDCQHVLDVGLAQATDAQICNYAEEQERVIISKDEDFLHLANRPGDAGKLLWVRIGNCRKQTLLQTLERELPGIVRAFIEGVRVVEIR